MAFSHKEKILNNNCYDIKTILTILFGCKISYSVKRTINHNYIFKKIMKYNYIKSCAQE